MLPVDPLFAHGEGEVVASFEYNVHDGIECAVGKTLGGADEVAGGIVEEYVYGPKFSCGFTDDIRYLFILTYVAGYTVNR